MIKINRKACVPFRERVRCEPEAVRRLLCIRAVEPCHLGGPLPRVPPASRLPSVPSGCSPPLPRHRLRARHCHALLGMADDVQQPAAATAAVTAPHVAHTAASVPAPPTPLFKRKSHKQTAARRPLSSALKDEEEEDKDKGESIESAQCSASIQSEHSDACPRPPAVCVCVSVCVC